MHQAYRAVEAPREATQSRWKQQVAHHDEIGRRADSIVKNMLLHSRSGPSEHRAIDLNTTVEEALYLAYHNARGLHRISSPCRARWRPATVC